MTIGDFFLGTVRVAAIVLPVLLTAHLLRSAYIRVAGAVAVLTETVISVSVLVVGAEALGLISLLRPAFLIAMFGVLAATSWAVLQRRSAVVLGHGAGSFGMLELRDRVTASTAIALLVVACQWLLRTANSLGGGMLSFDTLWYHMPFAARFAQTGAVTGVQFTQADAYTAYYPANSELFHGIGIAGMHSDFLSPLMNLLWFAIALLAAWLVGRPWRVQRETLCAGCLVLALPVLSSTQPGEGFNDIVGLAMLLAAVALAVNAADQPLMLAVVGLALGWAVGTKVTFIIPAFVLLISLPVLAPRRHRARALGVLVGTSALTGGWWYLRNLLAVGNPFGLHLDLGPVVFDGPVSPLANGQQGTLISNLEHFSRYSSRFAAGLYHALGPAWPLVLTLCLGAIVAALAHRGEPMIRVLALTGAAAGLSYFFLPTSASGIQHESGLFQVNLRYATPAIAVGLLLVPVVLRLHRRQWLSAVAPGFAGLVLITQLEGSLWPSQKLRHTVFWLVASCVAGGLIRVRALRLAGHRLLVILAVALLAAAGVAYVLQRHYFDRRYLTGDANRVGGGGIGAIYRWAQGVAHARIALYGTLAHYPLYGPRDQNRVDYLGIKTADGGFQRITTCPAWRTVLNRGHYRYVVLTGAPTGNIAAAWTREDPAATVILHPAGEEYVFGLARKLNPATCR